MRGRADPSKKCSVLAGFSFFPSGMASFKIRAEEVFQMILHPEELERESFRKLGEFEHLLTTSDTYTGAMTNEGFFPDVLRLCSDGKDLSVSVTKVCGESCIIDHCEIHSGCCEGILPLDGDIYIFAAPPFWYMQLDQTRVFRVPKGTMVKLKPGVIHGTPFSVTGEPVNVLILLPERTYSNDCQFISLDEKDQMVIER